MSRDRSNFPTHIKKIDADFNKEWGKMVDLSAERYGIVLGSQAAQGGSNDSGRKPRESVFTME